MVFISAFLTIWFSIFLSVSGSDALGKRQTSAISADSSSIIRLTGADTRSGLPTTSFTRTNTVTGSQSLPTYPIVSRFPVLVTHSGVVYISTATITIRPTSTNHVVATGSSTASKGQSNKGAIAGGVIGACAVLLAAFATWIFCFRRHSTRRWKARAGTWRNLDSKQPPLLGPSHLRSQSSNFPSHEGKSIPSDHHSPSGKGELGSPVNDPFQAAMETDVEPMPALYIREHRQPVQNPFADPPNSATTHQRRNSSFSALSPPTSPNPRG